MARTYTIINAEGKVETGTYKGRKVTRGRFNQYMATYNGMTAILKRFNRPDARRMFGIRRVVFQVQYLTV